MEHSTWNQKLSTNLELKLFWFKFHFKNSFPTPYSLVIFFTKVLCLSTYVCSTLVFTYEGSCFPWKTTIGWNKRDTYKLETCNMKSVTKIDDLTSYLYNVYSIVIKIYLLYFCLNFFLSITEILNFKSTTSFLWQ